MFITGLGTAAPCHAYTQKECWTVAQQTSAFKRLNPRSRAILRKVLTGNNGIVRRHLALDRLEEAFELTSEALQARFAEHAPLLATQAAERALADAGATAGQIDGMIISTCTGYLCPGLTSYVSQRLGLRANVLLLDLVGQGCGAALPNLRTAEAFLQAGKCRQVLSVCVEVCSAAFYLDNNPGVLISACLFGDGAGATVLAGTPNGQWRVNWKASGSLLQPKHRDVLRFEQKQGMLRNVLTPEVPMLAARYADELLEQVLRGEGIGRKEVVGWVLHPGGRDVLLALRKELGLTQQDVRWSEAVLREFGNLSSPSVFFVLEAARADSAPNGRWWMSSFGAGFSCHGALLEVG